MPDSRGQYQAGRGPADRTQADADTAGQADGDRSNGAVLGQGLVGRVISGRYRVVERIATGGMSTVYRGEHIHMLKHVAIKVLDPKAERLPELVQRFQREAIAGAHVQHPNIASATDFGQLEDGSYFLVLEYVSGTSLNHVIAQGPMPVERAVRIGRQVAAALQAAHSLSIVHRDVKPSNIMLLDGQDDFVKLIDFGLAQVRVDQVASVPQAPGRTSADEPLTGVGIVFGTVAYMAPEASLGMASVDVRSDLYALGIIMYEMLAGRHPFDGREPVQLFLQHRTTPPPPIAIRTPGVAVPPAVEAVIARLLEKDPKQRYQSAADVISALDNAMLSAAAGVQEDLSPSRPRGHAVPSATAAAALAAVLAEPSDHDASAALGGAKRLHAPALEGFAVPAPEPSLGAREPSIAGGRAPESDEATLAMGSVLRVPEPPSAAAPSTGRPRGAAGLQAGLASAGPRLPSFADEPSAPPFQLSRPVSGPPGAASPARGGAESVPPGRLPPPDPASPSSSRPDASRAARIDSDALPTIAIGASEVLRQLGHEASEHATGGRTRIRAESAANRENGRTLRSRVAWFANLPLPRTVHRAFREHPAACIGGVIGLGMLLLLLVVVAVAGREGATHPAPVTSSSAAPSKAEPIASVAGSASAAPAEGSSGPPARGALDELEVNTFKTALRNAQKNKDWPRGASATTSLLKLEPAALRDKELSAAMLAVAVGVGQTDGEAQDKFFSDLSRETGTAGLDALYEIARWRAWTKAGKRAKETLRVAEVMERAPAELRVLLDFYQASCMGKRALFNRMAEEGDSRAVTELVVLRDAQCNRWRDPCCFQENRELAKAIASLRTRLATREKSN